MRTIGSVLEQQKGFGQGFDLLRIGLALSVMVYHTAATVQLADPWREVPFWMFTAAILPMFFALSGFLISASAMRLSLGQFLLNRGLRIIPALAVEIILSALVIGPLFTSLPLHDYFTDRQFWHYFTNIVGLINYNLPGVFRENGQPGIVNAALWTIPYEVLCYMMISGIILASLFKRPFLIMIAIAVMTVAPAILEWTSLSETVQRMSVLHWFLFGRGTLLLASFLSGCWLYGLRDRIPLNGKMAMACLTILILLSFAPETTVIHNLNQSWLLCMAMSYLTVYIGLANVPKIPIISGGDYSYGIYLYHCPIINCVYYFTTWNHSVILLFAMSLLPVALFAAFSWTTIEKPILKLRKKFSFVGSRLH